MVLVAVRGDQYLIDTEDGNPMALVIRRLENDHLELYPRISSVDSMLRLGYWEPSTDEEFEWAQKTVAEYGFGSLRREESAPESESP